jgi:TPR repeat protein
VAGDAPAQDMLSWMLMEGEVVPPDLAAARHWAAAAAAQGIAAAMTRLGMIHHNALGVERDARAAAQWWAKAAELGDADAQAMLGAAFHLGAGVERDGVAALALLIRARAGGSALAAPFLDPVRRTLTPAEAAEAERRAASDAPGAAT